MVRLRGSPRRLGGDMATRKTAAKTLRLRRLEIRDFKAIDHVALDFHPPEMRDDPDIYVMGSRNGVGKTSILEACTILFFVLRRHADAPLIDPEAILNIPIDIAEKFVRSGASMAFIYGEFVLGTKYIPFDSSLDRFGQLRISVQHSEWLDTGIDVFSEDPSIGNKINRYFELLYGRDADPFVMRPLLYFHSFRKVQEGSPELGMMMKPDPMYGSRTQSGSGASTFVSTFKLQILRAMMGRANLFEHLEDEDADETLSKLNGLIQRYAGGRIDKLRPSSNNTIEFRITPDGGGESFAFDGLSSGQKEIISTLFMIWYNTRNQPGIVLIDEPELHLNAEWHRDFVQQVYAIAPRNQYIFATHSEDIFRSVDYERRLFLGSGSGEQKIGTGSENG
ncbi:MAG: AAA family ATPase [Magnetococcales bacterium]|nr:AAA family ATPase [Magnetococcales bacterium]